MRPNEIDHVAVLHHPPAASPTGVAEPSAAADATAEPDRLISFTARTIDMLAIVIPFAVFVGIALLAWGRGLNWVQLWIMIGMYLFTGFGVTVGFHRLLTHKAFVAHPITRTVLAVLGSMSVQGPLLWWVALHRRHHQHSDEVGDPHSPHQERHDSLLATLAGAWHSHVGWLLKPDAPGVTRYVPDLLKERALVRVSELYPLWVALSLSVPALLGGLLTRSWSGAIWGLVWGGLIRVFFVHHITWSVNSVCHLWGSRTFHTHDQSRNNALFGLLALGEGWHNNHHAFPTSARHGIGWWQVDLSYWVIRGLQAVGLASRVKVPAAQMMCEKRIDRAEQTSARLEETAG